ncbi:MAG: type II secretion system F family protein [Candidatus Liptonbacteria bacterium]|nr:type II secretion system F family protein [Candidatus Liptonbacteria bacterium]
MLFHYLAADKNGKITEGDLEVDNFNQALQYLAGKELRPISVKPIKEAGAGAAHHRIFGNINLTDKIFLTRYLALMLRVGTDLLSAIDILIADFDKPAMKSFLLEVRDNLGRGQPFNQTFARYPKIFSPVFISLVKAAEASGNLQKTFEDASVSLEREAALKNSIKSAMIYPIILLVTSVMIFVFLVAFALPKIANIFNESGIHPPLFSKVVFTIGLFVHDHALAFGGGAVFVVGFGIYFFFKNSVGHRLAQRLFARLPIVRKVYKELAVQRFAATTSSLMKAGLPIVQTINIAADTVNVEEFKFSLRRISEEGLAKGLTVSEAFKREVVFPKLVTNLIAVSEKAGHLEEVLETLANFYASRVESAIKSLVSILEPVMLLAMGVLVGTVALSIIVPIYQLTSQF